MRVSGRGRFRAEVAFGRASNVPWVCQGPAGLRRCLFGECGISVCTHARLLIPTRLPVFVHAAFRVSSVSARPGGGRRRAEATCASAVPQHEHARHCHTCWDVCFPLCHLPGAPNCGFHSVCSCPDLQAHWEWSGPRPACHLGLLAGSCPRPGQLGSASPAPRTLSLGKNTQAVSKAPLSCGKVPSCPTWPGHTPESVRGADGGPSAPCATAL